MYDAGQENQWGRGFWTSGSAGTYYNYAYANTAVYNNSVFYNSGTSNGASSCNTKRWRGSLVVWIDLHNATYSAKRALWLKQNDSISFGATAAHSIRNGSTNDSIDFVYNGVDFLNIIPSAKQIRPSVDNIVALGSAFNRWNAIYSGTGTINTSDDREKHIWILLKKKH